MTVTSVHIACKFQGKIYQGITTQDEAGRPISCHNTGIFLADYRSAFSAARKLSGMVVLIDDSVWAYRQATEKHKLKRTIFKGKPIKRTNPALDACRRGGMVNRKEIKEKSSNPLEDISAIESEEQNEDYTAVENYLY